MINNFLTSLFGLNIYVYGVGVFVTLVLFLFMFWRLVRKTAFNEEKMLDALLGAAVFGFTIGRIAYVVAHPDIFEAEWLRALIVVTYPGITEFWFWLAFFAYWFIYSARRKYVFSSLVKLLIIPIYVGKVSLSLFSLVKSGQLTDLLLTLFLALLLLIYFLISRLAKKENFREAYLLQLMLFLALPNFLVDFWHSERVYLLGLNLVSLEQLPYLVFLILLVIASIIKWIKNIRKGS